MTSYPGAVPALGTLSSADTVDVADFDNPNNEIVAIATELGINLRTIDDTVAPEATPGDVGDYLDQIANILKTMSGASAWYKAAVPPRMTICASGNDTNLPATYEAFIGPSGYVQAVSVTEGVISAEEAKSSWIIPVAGRVVVRSMYVELTRDGALNNDAAPWFVLRKNGSTVAVFSLPPLVPDVVIPAGVYYMTVSGAALVGSFGAPANLGSATIPFAAGDIMAIAVDSVSTAGDGYYIGGVGVEFDTGV